MYSEVFSGLRGASHFITGVRLEIVVIEVLLGLWMSKYRLDNQIVPI